MEEKRQGGFSRIDARNLPERDPVQGWIKGSRFSRPFTSACLCKQRRYLLSRCIWLAVILHAMEKPLKRSIRNDGKWRRFTIRSSPMPSCPESPTKRVRTQSDQCFMAIYAACRMEGLRVKHRLNHFALRSRLYLKAIRYAFHELQILTRCVTLNRQKEVPRLF